MKTEPACQIERLHRRIDALIDRVRKLEDASHPGFVCAHCRQQRSADWFVYEAHEIATNRTIRPICGKCAQEGTPGWGFRGPFPPSPLP